MSIEIIDPNCIIPYQIFDPSLKKKKKTKKPFDLNTLETDDGTSNKAEKETDISTAKEENADFTDLNDFSSIKKKKKKKTKAFNFDEMEGSLPDTAAEKTSDDSKDVAGEMRNEELNESHVVDDTFGDDDLDFNLPKKKKKKKKITFGETEQIEIDSQMAGEPDVGFVDGDRTNEAESNHVSSNANSGTSLSWANEDRDYTYEELLQHVFNIIKENNPDIIAGEKRRLVMRPPQVIRVGTKKTSFANFLEICKSYVYLMSGSFII